MTLKTWFRELADQLDGTRTLQYELIDALLGLRSQANRDGWMNWGDNHAEMVDLLLVHLPSGSRREDIERDLAAIREAGETGADEGRFAYEEIDRLAADLVFWCEQRPDWIDLPDGYDFWPDVPPDAVRTLKPSLLRNLIRRFIFPS